MKIKVFVVAIVVLIIVFLSIRDEGKPVRILLPDDYVVGQEYYVELDSKKGIEPKFVDGAWIYDYSVIGNKYKTFEHFNLGIKNL